MESNPRLGTLALLCLLVSTLLGTQLAAQVVEVELRDRKAPGAQGKYALEVDGRLLLRGEPVYALKIGDEGQIATPEWSFELFLSDPEDPDDLPYSWKNGQRVARSKARSVEIRVKDIVAIRLLAPYLTLDNLRDEVRARRETIAALERRWSSQTKASRTWFDALFWLLENQRRLQILLEHYGFAPAAAKLGPELERLSTAASADARWTRGQEALASIRELAPTARLVEAAQAISGGSDHFAVHESQHVRLVHDERIDDRRARALLVLGEEIIEGFRREFLDPFECPDLIPERIFAEFWFGPDEDDKYERYYEEYYRLSWGTPEQKKHSLRFYGTYPVRSAAPEFLSYGRAPWRDLEGLFAHRLGEQLAAIHFEARLQDLNKPRQPWLEESQGVYTSLALFAASTTACVSFTEESVSKTEGRARRYNESPTAYLQSLARASTRPLDQLVLRNFAELGAADVAKGWSLLRFLVADGERGQEVLHSVTKLGHEPATLLEKWREELRWLYDVKEGDPIDALESRWRAALPKEE